MISGEQFPNDIPIGEEFYRISTGEVYRYLGGNPAIPTNWIDIRGNAIFGQLYSNVNQLPNNLTPNVMTFNQNSGLVSITHPVGDSKVTVQFDGLYMIVFGIQVSRSGGGGAPHAADYWLRKNGADVINSGIRATLTNASDTVVLLGNFALNMVAGDNVEVVQAIDATGIGLGAVVLNSLAGGPLIPSIIFSIVRLAR